MTTRVEVTGLKELLERFRRFPQKYNKVVGITLVAALTALWEKVPSYPVGPAGVNTSKRTGTLGRSMGASMSGAKQGKPQIFTVKQGQGRVRSAEFGTRVGYAPRVIGDGTQENPWASYWWTMRTIAERAQAKITQLFEALARKLARYLEGNEGI